MISSEATTGVCCMHDVDFDELCNLNLLIEEDDESDNDDDDFVMECQPSSEVYSDGTWRWVDGGWDAAGATVILVVNYNCSTVQVLLSPKVKQCAPCSPCYPEQGDLDTAGDVLAYDLPEWLKAY